MKFQVVENFEGEKAHFCACEVTFTEPPTGDEIAAIATVDARKLWKFLRSIKRKHSKKFEHEAKRPEDVLTIALMKAPSFEQDLTKCSVYMSLEGAYFGLAPRWQDHYDLPFPVPISEPEKFEAYQIKDFKQEGLRDYHAFLVDAAEEYWSQAELRKNDTDRESMKMVMEFRQMHSHYSIMADELLNFMNTN